MTLPSAAPISLLTLRGSSALSHFRIEKLLTALRSQHPAVKTIRAEFVHFVQMAAPLSATEMVVLEKLLTYGDIHTEKFSKDGSGSGVSGKNGSSASPLLVLPRIGTISSWASKATDIAHNCGLGKIKRIERGTAFYIETATDDGVMTMAERDSILRMIHDPMTETVRFSFGDAAELFITQAPQPLAVVPTMRDGKSALERANRDMGLALSPDEID